MIKNRWLVVCLLIASCYPDHKLLDRPVNAYSIGYKQYHTRLDYGTKPRVRYIDVGSGKTILLIHGHQSRIEELALIIPKLAEHYRVVAFDLPGSGYSDQPDVEYSLDLYSEYVASFIRSYIKGPAIIAGGSMGGNLALKVSREHPELIIKTIAWSPAGVWPGHNILSWLAKHLMGGTLYRSILYGQSFFWFPKTKDCKEAHKNLIKYIDEVDTPIFRRSAAALASDQLNSKYSHIGNGHLNLKPTLIIAGELDDGLDLAKYAIAFAKELPDGKLIVMKNVGHSIHSENAGGLVKNMIEFIGE